MHHAQGWRQSKNSFVDSNPSIIPQHANACRTDSRNRVRGRLTDRQRPGWVSVSAVLFSKTLSIIQLSKTTNSSNSQKERQTHIWPWCPCLFLSNLKQKRKYQSLMTGKEKCPVFFLFNKVQKKLVWRGFWFVCWLFRLPLFCLRKQYVGEVYWSYLIA